MMELFNGIRLPPRSGALPVAFTARKVVDGGHTGFRLVGHETRDRNDWHDNDALPLARTMAQQTRRGAQRSVGYHPRSRPAPAPSDLPCFCTIVGQAYPLLLALFSKPNGSLLSTSSFDIL